ncbi:hypothetical protein SAMN02910322_01854 [Bacteroides thetaiotaomicron]|nr:hypothetical protein SAMN02910322_01854 [Bacteroides thetaiotaomicron]
MGKRELKYGKIRKAVPTGIYLFFKSGLCRHLLLPEQTEI